jgi:hypothetical protein
MTKHNPTIKGAPVFPISLDALEALADWKDELLREIRTALLRLELTGLDQNEIDQLASEVADFKAVCASVRGPKGEF